MFVFSVAPLIQTNEQQTRTPASMVPDWETGVLKPLPRAGPPLALTGEARNLKPAKFATKSFFLDKFWILMKFGILNPSENQNLKSSTLTHKI